MSDFWDREPENALEKERKMLFILQQVRQLGPFSLKITCPCGQDETYHLLVDASIVESFSAGNAPQGTLEKITMADFCRQCTKEVWGEDDSDFVLETSNVNEQTAYVLCEGCGYILVNAAGTCIDAECKLHGVQNRAKQRDESEERVES